MMNERNAASKNFGTKNFVTIREREWRFRDRRGPVATLMPIRGVPPFAELAVLTLANGTIRHFAARVAGTDDWAYFRYLQLWMLPLVEQYLVTSDRYQQIAEMVARTHRLTQ